MKDLKIVSTNILVSFLRPSKFENGLRNETEILVEEILDLSFFLFLNGNIKKTNDLKIVSTNISVFFLRPSMFENGLRKETEISIETNFRSFVFFILSFRNVASGYTLCQYSAVYYS